VAAALAEAGFTEGYRGWIIRDGAHRSSA